MLLLAVGHALWQKADGVSESLIVVGGHVFMFHSRKIPV